MDNAWDACRARAYTYPAGVVPSQASLAMKRVRTVDVISITRVISYLTGIVLGVRVNVAARLRRLLS